MADYQDLRTHFWIDKKVESWPASAKLLGLYFLTNPSMNVLGFYPCTPKLAAFHTGLPSKQLAKAWMLLQQPDEDPFFRYDEERGLVWVVKAFRYRMKSPKLISAAQVILRHRVDSPLVKLICDYYTDTVSLPSLNGSDMQAPKSVRPSGSTVRQKR